jgi:phosphoenolpyruvate synthase/pyruvate phosphate dikinase
MTKDEEIKRLNEKIEFLARTNMLYSDWEHRNTQVTSELIRKGIEEAKINAELRAEIEQLKAQLTEAKLKEKNFD